MSGRIGPQGLGAAAVAALWLLAGGCDNGDSGRGGGGLPGGAGGKGDCVGELCEATGPVKDAICEVDVADTPDNEGAKDVPMDPDYVAKVLSCDFADLGPKGLRAAAIAVRSAAYWQMATEDEVCTSDLLFCPDYSCDGTPSEKFREAAQETRGQYLSFNDVVTYGFYVPGVEIGEEYAETCEHPDEDSRVTINDGKKADKVEQSVIGKVAEEDDDTYGQNRGAMSIEVIACLEAKDTSPHDILRFFYGEDIEISQAPVDRDCVEDEGYDARFKFTAKRDDTDDELDWADYGVRVTDGDKADDDGEDTALAQSGEQGEAGIENLRAGKDYTVWMREKDQSDWEKCDQDLSSDEEKTTVQADIEFEIGDEGQVTGCKLDKAEAGELVLRVLLESDGNLDWSNIRTTISDSGSSAGSGDGKELLTRRAATKAWASVDGLDRDEEHFVWLREGTSDWERCDGEVPKIADSEQNVSVDVKASGGKLDSCEIAVGDDDTFELELTAENSDNSTGTTDSEIDWDDYEAGAGTGSSPADGKTKTLSDSGSKGLAEIDGLPQDSNVNVFVRKSGDWTKCANRVESPDDRLQAKLFVRFEDGDMKECSVGRDDTRDTSGTPDPEPEPDPDPEPDPEPDPDPDPDPDPEPSGTTGGEDDGGDTDGGDTGAESGDVYDGGDDRDDDDDDGGYDDGGYDDDGGYGDDDPYGDDDDDGGGWDPNADDDGGGSDPFGDDESGGETDGDTDGAGAEGGGGCSVNGSTPSPALGLLMLLAGWIRRRR